LLGDPDFYGNNKSLKGATKAAAIASEGHLRAMTSHSVTLGARGHLPRGHIEEVTLRFLKQFVHTVSRGYMLDPFVMYPPL